MMKPQASTSAMRGYIEGYYGRLFDWQDRSSMLAEMAALCMDVYLYAPKEDPFHRFDWRTPYPSDWQHDFSAFAAQAQGHNIRLAAGIAPGLDYSWHDPQADITALNAKADSLVASGAKCIVLMLDDIPETPEMFAGGAAKEGRAHGRLARDLARHIAPHGASVMFVPRLYADEMADLSAFDTGQPLSKAACQFTDEYARGLTEALPDDMPVLICGEHIVARNVNLDDQLGRFASQLRQPLIIWDNLYCHDYCPRRLFVGAYEGRRLSNPILLNGTGLLYTDSLLLKIMSGADNPASWKQIIAAAGIPDAFFRLAHFFDKPAFSDALAQSTHPVTTDDIAVINQLLWQWKSPLQREWYPYLFGLKHDIMIAQQMMKPLRIAKTQTPPMAALLQQIKD